MLFIRQTLENINLEKIELDMLAGFLVHDITIHREYYKLPEDTLQLAKCSKLLLLMEIGGVGIQHRKTIEEIEVNLKGNKRSSYVL